jgi:hypothetical protein
MESRPASFSADEISIDALYLKSCEHDQLVELTIELKRFRSWMTSFNMLEIEYLPPKTLSVISGFTVLNYARIIKALVAAKQDLMEEAEDSAGTKRDICSSLRWHNTALMNSVTQRYHMLARDRFETEILETQYSDLLDVTRSAIQDLGGDHRAASLLATKRMTILEERRSLICKPELKLRVRDLDMGEDIEHHIMTTIHANIQNHVENGFDTTPAGETRLSAKNSAFA